MKQYEGYLKLKLGNSVLLSDGSHKSLSDFIGSLYFDNETNTLQYKSAIDTNYTDLFQLGARAFDSTEYLPLSGGTISSDSYSIILNGLSNNFSGLALYYNNSLTTEFAWRSYGSYIYNHASHKLLGILENGTPYYGEHNGTLYTLLHSGNYNSYFSSGFLPISGGTLTGQLTMGSNLGISASGNSSRLVFRHIDGLNCNGNYDLYCSYHTGATTYFSGDKYYINSSLANLPEIRSGTTYIGSNAIGFNRNTSNGSTFNSGWYGGQIHVDASDGRMVFGLNTGSGSYYHAMYLYYNGNLQLNYGSYYVSSDKRLKKDILLLSKEELSNLFDASLNLFKRFTWKSNDITSYGFIAQEIQLYIPEAVSINPGSKYLTVSYDTAYAKIIPAIIYKVKELQEIIKNMEKRIKTLEANLAPPQKCKIVRMLERRWAA